MSIDVGLLNKLVLTGPTAPWSPPRPGGPAGPIIPFEPLSPFLDRSKINLTNFVPYIICYLIATHLFLPASLEVLFLLEDLKVRENRRDPYLLWGHWDPTKVTSKLFLCNVSVHTCTHDWNQNRRVMFVFLQVVHLDPSFQARPDFLGGLEDLLHPFRLGSLVLKWEKLRNSYSKWWMESRLRNIVKTKK